MKRSLSILIPMYNADPRLMARELCHQAQMIRDLDYEMIVVDDCSTDTDVMERCQEIGQWPHCRFMALEENIGRARIRNLLASLASKEWLLFLDCDMQLPGDQFLHNYLVSKGEEVVDGGFGVVENLAMARCNLRYIYEWNALPHHTFEQRSSNPYRSFRTTNFMIRRDLMLNHPFDERFLHYGFEDVLFGKELKKAGIDICHIDNPMMLADLEPNDVFTAKTEEALRTLSQFRNELRGYSQLLTVVEGIHIAPVRWLICLWHWLFGRLERRNLCGKHPSLLIFKLYKLGYFLTLNTQQ